MYCIFYLYILFYFYILYLVLAPPKKYIIYAKPNRMAIEYAPVRASLVNYEHYRWGHLTCKLP